MAGAEIFAGLRRIDAGSCEARGETSSDLVGQLVARDHCVRLALRHRRQLRIEPRRPEAMAGAIGVERRCRGGRIEMDGGDFARRVRIDRAGINGVADTAREGESEGQRNETTETHDALSWLPQHLALYPISVNQS